MSVETEPTDKPKRPAPKSAWKKGQSGNPAGRKKGSLNKSTINARRLAQKFLNEAVEPVFQKLVEKAKEGEVTAIKLVVERILPILKAFEEPKQVMHNIEVVLKQPDWLQIAEPERDITTIELNGSDEN
jgi:hypothetical protein